LALSFIGGINMSRALGDFRYKYPLNASEDHFKKDPNLREAVSANNCREVKNDFISSEPFTHSLSLEARRYILVLASDGVTNSMDDQQLIDIVAEKWTEGRSAGQIAQEVVDHSADRKGSDNCTCIVVLVDGS
jgi:serine/threonine protein phosphatase PrpC